MSLEWNDINWKMVHYRISKLQKRIAYATQVNDWKNVRCLQKMLINSYDGRLLAVLRVTSKKMKRTPGIDGKFWNTDEEKFEAVDKLRYKKYIPSPFKRIYVPKENDKTRVRPLSVPIIYDRAMQGLFLLAIDPVVETLADTHAYGFRKYRSSQDVIRDIVDTFRLNGGNQWILKADIHECFDHISHKWLLNHAPFNERILESILKCGYMYRGKWFPTVEGVPQGGVLSPVLTTHVLCGMEKIINDNYPDNNIKMVRFVDDFLFSGETEDDLLLVYNDLIDFLTERGLQLSPTKTKICHISQGVDFIGWNICRYNSGLKLNPTEKSINDVIKRIGDLIKQSTKWPVSILIERINCIIIGWGYYHIYKCSPTIFLNLDLLISKMLWKFVKDRHSLEDNLWIRKNYWKHTNSGYYFTSNGVDLMKLSDILVKVADTVDLTKNPYIDIEYFRLRRKQVSYITSISEYEYKQRIW